QHPAERSRTELTHHSLLPSTNASPDTVDAQADCELTFFSFILPTLPRPVDTIIHCLIILARCTVSRIQAAANSQSGTRPPAAPHSAVQSANTDLPAQPLSAAACIQREERRSWNLIPGDHTSVPE